MKIIIDNQVFKKYKDFMVGALVCQKINNKKHLKESFDLLEETADLIKLTFNPDTTESHHLIRGWKTIQLEKQQPHHSSVEKLIKDLLKNKTLKKSNTLINLCKYFTLKNLVPLGYDDLEYINGDLIYKIAEGEEIFRTDNKRVKVRKGELISRDNIAVLSRGLDYQQSKFTLPDKNTETALIHLEAMSPLKKEEIKNILNNIKTTLQSFVGGKIRIFILDKKKPELNLPGL